MQAAPNSRTNESCYKALPLIDDSSSLVPRGSSNLSLQQLFTPTSLILLVWMANNIGVTLLNKMAFATVNFRYPFSLTVVHMCWNTLGSMAYLRYSEASLKNTSDTLPLTTSSSQKKTLTSSQNTAILLFSILFSLNIAIGNVSLSYVSVNFNQVMRSLVPALTLGYGMYQGKQFSGSRKIAVTLVVFGVACSCYGDMSYTMLGFVYTVMCVLLAAGKVIASGEMLTGELKLGPVELLAKMAPLAMMQCAVISVLNGEIASILSRPDLRNANVIGVVMLSGIASFSLNISSLVANKMTSPLTLCICANVKQVLMMGLSTYLFGTEISLLNGTGIAVVLMASARYSYVCITEKGGQSHK